MRGAGRRCTRQLVSMDNTSIITQVANPKDEESVSSSQDKGKGNGRREGGRASARGNKRTDSCLFTFSHARIWCFIFVIYVAGGLTVCSAPRCSALRTASAKKTLKRPPCVTIKTSIVQQKETNTSRHDDKIRPRSNFIDCPPSPSVSLNAPHVQFDQFRLVNNRIYFIYLFF